MKKPEFKSRQEFEVLVINVSSRNDRKNVMMGRLNSLDLRHTFVDAVVPVDLEKRSKTYLSETAECVWRSHKKCLAIASKNDSPTVILEDDAILNLNIRQLISLVEDMSRLEIDFIQIGFLHLNLADTISIHLRNIYDKITRKQIAPRLFQWLGFNEVHRAEGQLWRKNLPKEFVVNDIRYGAHCYLVTPEFAERMLELNSPAFLSADDFYVALGKMKSFKMIRLAKSLSPQDDSASSFIKRFLLE